MHWPSLRDCATQFIERAVSVVIRSSSTKSNSISNTKKFAVCLSVQTWLPPSLFHAAPVTEGYWHFYLLLQNTDPSVHL